MFAVPQLSAKEDVAVSMRVLVLAVTLACWIAPAAAAGPPAQELRLVTEHAFDPVSDRDRWVVWRQPGRDPEDLRSGPLGTYDAATGRAGLVQVCGDDWSVESVRAGAGLALVGCTAGQELVDLVTGRVTPLPATVGNARRIEWSATGRRWVVGEGRCGRARCVVAISRSATRVRTLPGRPAIDPDAADLRPRDACPDRRGRQPVRGLGSDEQYREIVRLPDGVGVRGCDGRTRRISRSAPKEVDLQGDWAAIAGSSTVVRTFDLRRGRQTRWLVPGPVWTTDAASPVLPVVLSKHLLVETPQSSACRSGFCAVTDSRLYVGRLPRR